MTTNVCLQAIRDGARRNARVEEFDDFEDDDMFDLQNRVAVSLDVRAAVDALAKPFRDVVVLCFFYDMDHENIASILGISPVTVRTRLHKAKKRLEPLLAESFGVSVRATGVRTGEVG